MKILKIQSKYPKEHSLECYIVKIQTQGPKLTKYTTRLSYTSIVSHLDLARGSEASSYGGQMRMSWNKKKKQRN